jgi:uncharacterized membrane protein YcaP (DUF421 family)
MAIDWRAVFWPDHPLLETVLRGTLTYLGIIALMRMVLKRQSGSMGLGDMLLLVLIADASQNAMIGEAMSWPNGLVLVATLIGWNYAIDWCTYYSPKFRKLMEPEPALLIVDGRVQRENLHKEGITDDELQAHLRLKGIESVEEVREARLESEGDFSVIRKHDEERKPRGAGGSAGLGADSTEELREAVSRLARAVEELEGLVRASGGPRKA